MVEDVARDLRRERRRGRTGEAGSESSRRPDYRSLKNPFLPQPIFSEDQVAAIHDTALRVLEELGIKVLLPEARHVLAGAGALVDEDSQMVRIGRDLVEAALASAPRSIKAHGGARDRDLMLELGSMTFLAGAGAPNVTDLERGRRPGTLAANEELTKLIQHFDVLHMLCPSIEPQDVDNRFRHYAVNRAQLTLSDKFPFVFARGTPQVDDSFEMVRLARGLSEDEFRAGAHCYTVINTNSPRQLDIPMAQGIIDFARAGQVSIITPFCLAGAMAPITVAGALTLQHAEALAGLTLAQIVRPGAPVVYGSFSSNVDMKSGAPAFGTPEHVKATLGAGQLARFTGLPWRSGGGSAANISDAQAAHETQFALWGSVLAGATVCIHAAGWLEGGLSVSYEKLITDIEALQTVAELCARTPGDEGSIGFEAIAEVQPGGHFFSAGHTMARYRTAFYEPLVADWSNFGNWTQSGSKSAAERATGIWKRLLADFQPPASAAATAGLLDEFIARRTEEGGAAPVS
ncbi:trimethylamine methyltransferase family protein [Mesorhizobium sp.]|uniref:trimethylamine methyltransferase family protein n=2 Tax=Mesorhizobium sp. TaxID=1871066 RepID=UPI000FD4C675|nr:trimethylamine methyltransferase family protein [Mesorhizobium sp.]RVC58775.1 trimethylamine methyltransferase [Mesorhizobium sp. M4B.F.Ca.ET.088.02.2.1]RWF33084.1 MAG: trimethylamine methyltransferase [Mesorhizobium sp.]TIX13183.1 MAG: trimethylamine methyltransferase [Mesorhizobium sp.]TJW02019.1 MAG: trimethylamine methyltransferase [Mesorhizobium sp.]